MTVGDPIAARCGNYSVSRVRVLKERASVQSQQTTMTASSSSSSSSSSLKELHDQVLRHDMFELLCTMLDDFGDGMKRSIARRLRSKRAMPVSVAELQESDELLRLKSALAAAHAEVDCVAQHFAVLLQKAHSDTALAAVAAQRDTQMDERVAAMRHAQHELNAFRVVSLLERIAKYSAGRNAARAAAAAATAAAVAARAAAVTAVANASPPPITRRASLGFIERRRSLSIEGPDASELESSTKSDDTS